MSNLAPRLTRCVLGCAASTLALALAACGASGGAAERPRPGRSVSAGTSDPTGERANTPATASRGPTAKASPQLPQGGRKVFPRYRVVAYYGTAGSGSLGVLGSAPPEKIVPRLRRVAAKYDTPGREIQIAFELIVTVADGSPGPDGSYSHTIDRSAVRRYLEAARRNDALLILDIQPGRTGFLPAVKQWEPVLKSPNVGVALDAEWRMAPGQVPGQTVGQVRAAEINRVSAYVSKLVERNNLPQKIFLLHLFQGSMLPDIARIEDRPGLAMVQHLDGFGTRKVKLSKYRKLQRPGQFHMGFKLFYDEDTNLMPPARVLDLDPPPDYVSYQ